MCDAGLVVIQSEQTAGYKHPLTIGRQKDTEVHRQKDTHADERKGPAFFVFVACFFTNSYFHYS